MTETQTPAPAAPLRPWLLATLALVVAQAVTLAAMGQPLICACGTVKLWHGAVSSPETSQHITDWYTFSHVLHGFIFYAALWAIAPKSPIGLRLLIAVGVEIGWELLENSPMIVERYRQSALAQGYTGDSVLNSVMDTVAAAAGFALAHRFSARVIVAATIAVELAMLWLVRDNLTLNILQLVYPSDAVSKWQTGG